MQIIPAIDIKDGVCLRATGVDIDPVAQASDFIEHGAKYLHVVDMNAALDGTAKNFTQLRHIIDLQDVKVEVSAGIDSPDKINKFFTLKPRPWQIILSSRALFDLSFVQTALNRFGAEHITIALDYAEDKIAARGWKETSSLSLESVLKKLAEWHVKRTIITDVNRDGKLTGIDTKTIQHVRKQLPGDLIVSGGIAALEDILELEDLGVNGVIIGTAFYEKKIDLQEALAFGNTV